MWQNVDGMFSELDSKCLSIGIDELSKLFKDNIRCLEIGSFRGKSACCLIENLISKKMFPCSIICIDNFNPKETQDHANPINKTTLVENIRGYKNPNVIANLIDNDATDKRLIDSLPDNHYHYVMVDAEHSQEFTYKMAELYWPKLVTGGIILFHDYHSAEWPGVTNAVDTFFADKPHKILHLHDNLDGKSLYGCVSIQKI